jgi:hypothetical protein
MKCARSNATCHRTLRVTGAADLVDLPRADKREFRYHIGCSLQARVLSCLLEF